jgi:hypothetical protein
MAHGKTKKAATVGKIKVSRPSYPSKTAPMKKAFDSAVANFKKKKSLKAPKAEKYKGAWDNFPVLKHKLKK